MSNWNGDNQNQSFADDELEEDYYSILNVSKDATDKDITQAYHKLGLVYHPDKHKDPESKRNAEILFAKIKNVYNVLIDPHKRAIYDSIGVKGLKEDNLQLVVRSKSPKEIREEYERLSREEEERRLEKLTRSQGYFSMQLDVSPLFDTYQRIDESILKIGDFKMHQAVDLPISIKDSLSVSGDLQTVNGAGYGSVNANFSRILASDTILDFNASIGQNGKFGVTGFKNFSSRCNGQARVFLKLKRNGLSPIFLKKITYRLDENLIGELQFRTGIDVINTSAMTTSLGYSGSNFHVIISVQLSIKSSHIALDLSRKFLDNTLNLKTSMQYGVQGASLSYGIEKQLTEHSKIDATMLISSVEGVSLTITVERGPQSFIVPITLSNEVLPSSIFYGTITPLICFYVLKKLVVDPYLKDKKEEEAKRKQEKLKSEIVEKRRLAMAAQELMKEAVLRIINKEGENGLIIKEAYYGKIQDQINSNSQSQINVNDKIIDVRLPLQFMVSDHSLVILNDKSKSCLEGFYDPCIGEEKSLYIFYEYNGEPYQATFSDNDVVRLPKSLHKVKWWSRPFTSVKK